MTARRKEFVFAADGTLATRRIVVRDGADVVADLAWDYLVTPVAARPNEAEPWSELGARIAAAGDPGGALRAHDQAARIDPTNANHLYAQAEILRGAGRRAEAKALYAKIAAATWRPEFEQLKRQAAALAR